jgi:hypothetical protein
MTCPSLIKRFQLFMALPLFCLLPYFANAQHTHSALRNTKTTVPPWAAAHHYDATAHAYFPDYYTYYDPARGGYVFWDNGKWTFTPALPPFLEKVDLRKSRVKILKGLSLDLHPELNYPHYMKLYPAVHENNLVPVPVPGAPGNR